MCRGKRRYSDEGGPATIRHAGGQRPNVRPHEGRIVPGPAPADKGGEWQDDSLSQLVSDTGLIREVARANVELIDLSERINTAVERWTAEAKRRKERLTASAVSGSPDTKEDEA